MEATAYRTVSEIREEKIARFMRCANSDRDTAVAYLEAEQWSVWWALDDYWLDRDYERERRQPCSEN